MMQSWAFYNHSRLKMEKVGAKRWVCREGKITRENTDTWDEPREAYERRVCVMCVCTRKEREGEGESEVVGWLQKLQTLMLSCFGK